MARLSRIAPEVPVSDLKGAVSFYEQKLGFRVVTDLDGADYAIVERDDVAIHLFRDTSGTLTPVGLHIFTNELEELQTELQQRRTLLAQQIMRKPWGNRDFRANDESGNQIKFTEPLS